MFSVGKAAVITVAPVGGEKSTKLMSRMKMRSLLSKCLGALPARRNKGVDRKDAERGEGGTRMLRGATPASTCARCTRSTRDEIFYAPLSPSVRPLELHAIQPRCSPPERLDIDHTSIVLLHRRSLISLSPFSLSLYLISSLDFVALAQPCQDREPILENNKTTNENKFVKF